MTLARNETRIERNETRLERNETRLARNETRGGNLHLGGTVRCLGTGRIYIRPVQIDITLDDSNLDWGEQYEDCMICKMPVVL